MCQQSICGPKEVPRTLRATIWQKVHESLVKDWIPRDFPKDLRWDFLGIIPLIPGGLGILVHDWSRIPELTNKMPEKTSGMIDMISISITSYYVWGTGIPNVLSLESSNPFHICFHFIFLEFLWDWDSEWKTICNNHRISLF